MMHPVRRIVTTNNKQGRSKVLIDGRADKTIGVLTELWITDRRRPAMKAKSDNAAKSDQLEPPRRGTLFRYFQIAPEILTSHLPREERSVLAREWFAEMKGGHLQPDTAPTSSDAQIKDHRLHHPA